MTDVLAGQAPAPVSEPVPAAAVPAPSAPEPQAPEPTPVATEPMSRREVRRAIKQERQARTPEPAPVESAPEPVTAPVETGTPTDTLPPVPTGSAELAAPALAAPAAQPIVIEIPLGHALRDMGLKQLTASNPTEERALRSLLNSHVRRQEVALAQKKAAELQEQLVRIEAEKAAEAKWRQLPEFKTHQQRYQELMDAYGEEVANNYLKGVRDQLAALTDAEYQERMGQVVSQRNAEAAQAFANTAWEHANRLPEQIRTLPEFGRFFQQSLEGFNDAISRGHIVDVRPGDREGLLRAFTTFFSAHLLRQPQVVAAFGRMEEQKRLQEKTAAEQAAAKQRELDAIKKRAVDEHMKSLADKRQAAPPHPLGNLQPVSRDRVPAAGQSGADSPVTASPSQLRRQQRQGAREDARQRFGR